MNFILWTIYWPSMHIVPDPGLSWNTHTHIHQACFSYQFSSSAEPSLLHIVVQFGFTSAAHFRLFWVSLFRHPGHNGTSVFYDAPPSMSSPVILLLWFYNMMENGHFVSTGISIIRTFCVQLFVPLNDCVNQCTLLRYADNQLLFIDIAIPIVLGYRSLHGLYYSRHALLIFPSWDEYLWMVSCLCHLTLPFPPHSL